MGTHGLVALDLGGVIVDVDRARSARMLGVPVEALARAFFSGTEHDDVTVGRVSGEAFLAAAAARLGLPLAEVGAAWAAMVGVWPAGALLVRELVDAGHAVHLWSNTDPVHLAAIVADLPAGVVVDTVSFRLGAPKPDPRFFRSALALGRPALYLDDRADFVAAARAEGVEARVCEGPAAARSLLVEAGLLPAR